MGTLYLVATPIGNLEDITLRALRVLREVPLIAAEDTRRTRKLLTHYEIKTPLVSYHEHSKPARRSELVEMLAGHDLALVTDAGTPGISDPGYGLVQSALAAGWQVVPVPGPSAPLAALVVSGLPAERFLFAGYLPRKAGERRKALALLRDQAATLIFFEVPHRVLDSLQDLVEILGADRQVAVARELTKVHEQFLRGRLADVLDEMKNQPARGEYTLIVEGQASRQAWTEAEVQARLAELIEGGASRAAAARAVASESGWTRNQVYKLGLEEIMNLDDSATFKKLDPADMLAEIDALPDQLADAWALGQRQPLGDISGIRQLVLAGMGGSAIGADLLAAYAAPLASVPLIVWRDYDLPAFALNQETLVVACSHSGNTEETLSAFEMALDLNVPAIAVSTGGALGERARASGKPFWAFQHGGQPRAAVGYSFGLLLALVARLGMIPDPEDELAAAVQAMKVQQQEIQAGSPVAENSAKRMAGQFMDRWPTIIGSGILEPVARRWRTQIAELAKALAQFEALPEADHNMVAGVMQPERLFGSTMVIFLRASLEDERNLRRVDVTRSLLMLEGFNTDVIKAAGETRLAQQWTSLHYGDYTAYYLAMAYGIDPTPVEAIEDLKRRLKAV